MTNYYHVLGVDDDATLDEIKEAYRAQAFKTHPDRRNGDGDHEQFVKVRDAYEVLSDPQRRARHDRKLKQQRARHVHPLRDHKTSGRVQRYGAEWHRRKSRQRRRRMGSFDRGDIGTFADSMKVLRYGLVTVAFLPFVYFLFGTKPVAIALIAVICLVAALCLADLFDDVVLGGRLKDLLGR